jgi:hypothetical protein
LGLETTSTLFNTIGDIHVLPKVLNAAARFQVGPSDDAIQAMAQRLGMTSLFVD